MLPHVRNRRLNSSNAHSLTPVSLALARQNPGTMLARSFSTAVRLERGPKSRPSDIIEQLLKLQPKASQESVQQILARHHWDRKSLRWAMQLRS